MLENVRPLVASHWQQGLIAAINKLPLGDVLVECDTGTGKSLGYLLALKERLGSNDISTLSSQRKDHGSAFRGLTLIMVPHLNLGRQIYQWARNLMAANDIHLINTAEQIPRSLYNKPHHILISTPHNSHVLKDVPFQTIILDEVDEMMKALSRYAPDHKKRCWMKHPPPIYFAMDEWSKRKQHQKDLFQVVALSATFNHVTRREMVLRQWISKNAIRIEEDQKVMDRLVHIFYESSTLDLNGIMKRVEQHSPKKVLLIVSGETSELGVVSELRHLQWNAMSWSDIQMGINRRESLLLCEKSFPIVVCQAGNCRGMDDKDLSHVVIACLVNAPSDYRHMAGRTGRQGNLGTVISFLPPNKVQELIHYLKLKQIQRHTYE
jgi:superfamily II DNA/RNA helicase